jgi:hypothetical protein
VRYGFLAAVAKYSSTFWDMGPVEFHKISEELTAFIFRIEEEAKRAISEKHTPTRRHISEDRTLHTLVCTL